MTEIVRNPIQFQTGKHRTHRFRDVIKIFFLLHYLNRKLLDGMAWKFPWFFSTVWRRLCTNFKLICCNVLFLGKKIRAKILKYHTRYDTRFCSLGFKGFELHVILTSIKWGILVRIRDWNEINVRVFKKKKKKLRLWL